MGKKRRILLFVLAGIFLACFAWLVLVPHEPVYQGKTLSAWLEEANKSEVTEYESANPAAMNAIRQIGTNALPTLLRLVATRDSRFRKALLELREKQPWISFPIHSQNEYQMMAGNGFFVLGPAAKPAVAELIAMLKDEDPEVRTFAASCLGLIGPSAKDAVPALIATLTTNRLDIVEGTFALRKIGPAASAAIPMLHKFTNGLNFAWAAVQATLIEIGGDSLSPFFDQLKDTSNSTNWIYAARVVELCPRKAEPAIPFFVAALNQTNEMIQNGALVSLGMIHQQADICVPAIAPLLRSKDPGIRQESLIALHKFGSASKPAVPEIIECLNDPVWTVRRMATNALRDIDPEAAAKAVVK